MLRMILATIPLFFGISCTTAIPTSGDAICDASRVARAEHAAALAASPDDRAVVTGAKLITQIDAACQ